MSTNKTQNYNLHSWVPEDDFIRSEFNDNFTGIDTALKTLSDGIAAETTARTAAVTAEKTAREQAVNAEKTAREQAVAAEATARASAVTAEENARKQAVTAEQNARVAAINSLTTAKAELVVGSYQGGIYDSEGTYNRTINLGFAPKAILILRDDGCTTLINDVGGGLLLQGSKLYELSTRGVAAELNGNILSLYPVGNMNQRNREYRYIAVK